MPSGLDALLSPADQERVLAAIRTVEAKTSGQVKVHVEARCPEADPMARARLLFVRLGLPRTRHRNAVLLYVAPLDRRFAVVGDEGIHARAGEPLWSRAAERMRPAFARGALGDGLCGAIDEVGAVLAAEFPPDGGGNEIPDAIST